MITLEHDSLVFRFPELHPDARVSISFQRTLRIPDDGRDCPLPPGLGRFPLRHVDDYAGRLPVQMTERGGVILPMHQAEAMWLSFDSHGVSSPCPVALKVATGKINAVTGERWSQPLSADPQDYLALPEQPWLDGYCVEKGVIRQFVAAPMDRGITVEEQLTVESRWGGIQLLAVPMRAEKYGELRARWEGDWANRARACHEDDPFIFHEEKRPDLGLAPGGRMRQAVYDNPHDISVWDQENGSRCFVTLLDATAWTAITGESIPTTPVDAAQYTTAGLPWFDYYLDLPSVAGSSLLNSIESVAKTWIGPSPAGPFDKPIPPAKVRELGRRRVREMRE